MWWLCADLQPEVALHAPEQEERMVIDGPAPPAWSPSTGSAGTFLLISWQRKAKLNLLDAEGMEQAAVHRGSIFFML